MKKPASEDAGFFNALSKAQNRCLHKALELVLEARNTAAAIEARAFAAGPGRVRAGIDIQNQLVAFFAIGRAGLVFGAIGHHDGDEVVIGVRIGFHVDAFLSCCDTDC